MRQQNHQYEETHIGTTQNIQLDVERSEKESNLESTQPKEDPVPIPLEPIVIVKENKENSPLKLSPNVKAATEHQDRTVKHFSRNFEEHSMISDQTQSSDTTFVV